MSNRTSRRGLRVGSKVWVNIDQSHADLLEDMALVDENGNILPGIRMQGTIQEKQVNRYIVYLDAAVGNFGFVREKTFELKNLTPPPDYYVAVNEGITRVRGLVFSKENRPSSYHLTEKAAESELQAIVEESGSKVTDTASAASSATTTAANASSVNPIPAATDTTRKTKKKSVYQNSER